MRHSRFSFLNRWKHIGLIAVIAIFLGIVIVHFDFVPFWDGAAYYNCLADAVQSKFNLLDFRCSGHLSIAYFLFMSLLQYIDLGNMPFLYITNAALAIASIIA